MKFRSSQVAVLGLIVALLLVTATPVADRATAAASDEMADIMNQGGDGIYAAGGVSIMRTASALNVYLSMPTPESGAYTYPSGASPGNPEVFTGWAFVFNYPEDCSGPCDGNDLGNTPAKGGAYGFDGRIAGAATLNLSGMIAIGEEPYVGAPLESPTTAEVHVAVAPHGAVDPAILQEQLTTPIGSPACACWWVALLKDPPGTVSAPHASETVDLMTQGQAGVQSSNAVSLTRHAESLGFAVSMATPAPGHYVYPEGAAQTGLPEVFTGWAFVFNHPEKCSGPCDGDDLGDTPARGGAYGFDGRVALGKTLELSGMVAIGDEPYVGVPLSSPSTAEVHIAVAPHGGLDLSIAAEQLTTPIGSPACDCWWIGLFKDLPSTAAGSNGAVISPPSTGGGGLRAGD